MNTASKIIVRSVQCALLFFCAALAQSADPSGIRVAVFNDVGTGKSIKNLANALADTEQFSVTKITAEEIRDGELKKYDVLIHPGGSGSKQGRELGNNGREKVRKFVHDGGGFIGICAGAYLASADYDWSLHILDAKVLDRKHWARGTGRVQLTMHDPARKILGDDRAQVEVYYGQGPLLAPADDSDITDYTVLSDYKTEIAKNGAPRGVMPGTTAIAAAPFGKGRVLCFSPHPEKTEGLEFYVERAVIWAATAVADEK